MNVEVTRNFYYLLLERLGADAGARTIDSIDRKMSSHIRPHQVSPGGCGNESGGGEAPTDTEMTSRSGI